MGQLQLCEAARRPLGGHHEIFVRKCLSTKIFRVNTGTKLSGEAFWARPYVRIIAELTKNDDST